MFGTGRLVNKEGNAAHLESRTAAVGGGRYLTKTVSPKRWAAVQ